MEHPKQGFGIPARQLASRAAQGLGRNRCSTTNRCGREASSIRCRFEKHGHEHLTGRAEWAIRIWDVLMFQAWLAEYSAGERTLRVMVVIGALPRAGAERVVSRLTREWSRRHDVIVALFDGSRSAYEVGGRVVDLQLPAGGGLPKTVIRVGMRALRLAATFRRERPDRVISFMERANVPSIVAAALTGMLGRLWVSVRNNPASIRAYWRMLIPVMYPAS